MVDKFTIKENNCYLNNYERFSYEDENCIAYFKGSITYNYELIEPEIWIKLLIKYLVDSKNSFDSVLASELNRIAGLFSLIIEKDGIYYIVSDIIRSKPVFYGHYRNNVFITDNLGNFQKHNQGIEINNDNLDELTVFGFVFGNGTVYKNIYGLQAGEIVSISGNKIRSKRYFEFKPANRPGKCKNLSKFADDYHKILLSIFSLMIKENPDVNRWIVPLSGGHDSRLTVNYLHLLGIRNVICFSYGIPNNEQSNISKKVAEATGYEWHFVEYTEQKWQALHERGIIDDFISYACNGVSTPLLQDFLAIYELRERKIINRGDIIVKSHGDFIAGSHLNDVEVPCTTEQDALDRVIARHCKISNKSIAPVGRMKEIYKKAKVKPLHFQEYFDWQERQAKFIVNSAKVYEYFDLKCILPYWHRENVNFWLSVSDNQRSDRKIFFEAEKQGILIDALVSLPFAGESIKPSSFSLISMVKNMLPPSLVLIFLHLTGRKVKIAEGMNMMFALKARSIRKLLDPVSDFPYQVLDYFKNILMRYPYQVDPHLLTSLYTIRKLLDKNK